MITPVGPHNTTQECNDDAFSDRSEVIDQIKLFLTEKELIANMSSEGINKKKINSNKILILT